MLVVDISNKKKCRTKNRAHRLAGVLPNQQLKVGVVVQTLELCIKFRFFKITCLNLSKTSTYWVPLKRYFKELLFQRNFVALAQFSWKLQCTEVKRSDQSSKKMLMLCFILFLAMSHDSITGYVCRPIGLSIGLSVGLFVSPSVGPPFVCLLVRWFVMLLRSLLR